MADPTKPQADERHTPIAEDDSTVQIPADQVHPVLRDSPHPNQAQLHTLKRGEETVEVTTEELIQRAQKGWNADVLTQEAAQVRKDATKAQAVYEDLEQVFEGDIDAFRRVGAQFKVPGDKVEAIAQKTFGSEDAEDDDEDVVNDYFDESSRANKQATRSRSEGPVDYSRLAPDVQRVLRRAETTRIDEIVTAALDKDETIAYNMEAHTPKGREAIRQYVDEKIRGRLDSFGGDFGDGTRILAEVIPEVRDHLQALGTPGRRTHTGLGQAPGGGDSEVHPTKRPTHVASSEGDAFEQNVLEDMQWAQSQVERGKTL